MLMSNESHSEMVTGKGSHFESPACTITKLADVRVVAALREDVAPAVLDEAEAAEAMG